MAGTNDLNLVLGQMYTSQFNTPLDFKGRFMLTNGLDKATADMIANYDLSGHFMATGTNRVNKPDPKFFKPNNPNYDRTKSIYKAPTPDEIKAAIKAGDLLEDGLSKNTTAPFFGYGGVRTSDGYTFIQLNDGSWDQTR